MGLDRWRNDWRIKVSLQLHCQLWITTLAGQPLHSFGEMTLLHFVQHYSMPKNVSEEPVARKMIVVRVRPYCSPDTSGPQYEQYCQQKLMLHNSVLARPFPKGTVPFGAPNVPFGSAPKPIMCPLAPPTYF